MLKVSADSRADDVCGAERGRNLPRTCTRRKRTQRERMAER